MCELESGGVLASIPQVLIVGIHINCFTVTWEVNSVFPNKSIIHSYLTFKPLYLSRNFEFHFLFKECCVWRFVQFSLGPDNTSKSLSLSSLVNTCVFFLALEVSLLCDGLLN